MSKYIICVAIIIIIIVLIIAAFNRNIKLYETYYADYYDKNSVPDNLPLTDANNPNDCQISWTPWSACSVPCGGTGTQSRTGSIFRQAFPGGKPCPTQSNGSLIIHETNSCDNGPCPIDCVMDDKWLFVHNCDAQCGEQGTILYQKNIITPAQYGGKPCDNSKSVKCYGLALPAWQPNGHCIPNKPGACGLSSGTQNWIRQVNPALCPFSASASNTPCDIPCPINCKMSDWQVAGTCQLTNNVCFSNGSRAITTVGQEAVTRTVMAPAQYGGTCDEPLTGFQDCTYNCPIDCVFGDIQESTVLANCVADNNITGCGPGQIAKTRIIAQHAKHGGACESNFYEPCTVPCTQDCQMSEWMDITPCEGACQPTDIYTFDSQFLQNHQSMPGNRNMGVKTQQKFIITPPSGGGAECPPMSETVRYAECEDTVPCPVDCKIQLTTIPGQNCILPQASGKTCGEGTQLYNSTIIQPANTGGKCPQHVKTTTITRPCQIPCGQNKTYISAMPRNPQHGVDNGTSCITNNGNNSVVNQCKNGNQTFFMADDNTIRTQDLSHCLKSDLSWQNCAYANTDPKDSNYQWSYQNYNIINSHTGDCITAPPSNIDNNMLQMQACSSKNSNQKWYTDEDIDCIVSNYISTDDKSYIDQQFAIGMQTDKSVFESSQKQSYHYGQGYSSSTVNNYNTGVFTQYASVVTPQINNGAPCQLTNKMPSTTSAIVSKAPRQPELGKDNGISCLTPNLTVEACPSDTAHLFLMPGDNTIRQHDNTSQCLKSDLTWDSCAQTTTDSNFFWNIGDTISSVVHKSYCLTAPSNNNDGDSVTMVRCGVDGMGNRQNWVSFPDQPVDCQLGKYANTKVCGNLSPIPVGLYAMGTLQELAPIITPSINGGKSCSANIPGPACSNLLPLFYHTTFSFTFGDHSGNAFWVYSEGMAGDSSNHSIANATQLAVNTSSDWYEFTWQDQPYTYSNLNSNYEYKLNSQGTENERHCRYGGPYNRQFELWPDWTKKDYIFGDDYKPLQIL